jgi:hypothetical protein
MDVSAGALLFDTQTEFPIRLKYVKSAKASTDVPTTVS